MVTTHLQRAFLVLFLGVMPFAACDCGNDPINEIPVDQVCNLDRDCGSDTQAFRNGECQAAGCETDGDCCPGTRCRLDFNACFPHQLDAEYACEADSDCADPGQRCLEVTLGDRDPIRACGFETCEGDNECGEGRSCYEGQCVQTAPCGGGCPTGEVCDIKTSQCHPVPEGAAGCSDTCESGLLVLRDADDMSGDVCCEIACSCRGLPPIVPANFGKYNDVITTDTEVLVSAYDSEYGDLVLARYSLEGALRRTQYLDGIPLGASVLADPDGPRGGIAEAGPDVGTHTSIAVNGEGLARIAYHDVENASLKVAVETADGFLTHTVDGGAGIVGTYTDIAVDPQGNTVISYMVQDVTGAPGIAGAASGVKVARSTTGAPSSPADWSLDFLDARAAFDPCQGCAANNECVIGAEGAECLVVASDCEEECRSTQFCVAGGEGSTCLANAIPPSTSDFPKARGMHTSIFVDANGTVVAYYDSIDGDLRVATQTPGSTANVSVIDGDGQDGARSGDVGRFPAITKIGAEYLIVYTDFSFHEVRSWQGTDPHAGGAYSVLDSGKVQDSPGKRFVGGGASIALEAGGAPVVVYQDATTLDLKAATLLGPGWTTTALPDLEPGAHGFFSNIALRNGNAYITSVLAQLDGRGLERVRLGLTIRAFP